MKIGNLVRPLKQPIDIDGDLIDLSTLGIVHEKCGVIVRVRWPDGRILTFNICSLEDMG